MGNDIKLFEGKQIRSSWNNEKEEEILIIY